MGNYYSNITLRGPAQSTVAEMVGRLGLAACVSRETAGFTVVFLDYLESLSRVPLDKLTNTLSDRLNCLALTVLNCHDDALQYYLFASGQKIDEYDSCPGYGDDNRSFLAFLLKRPLGPATPTAPKGGDARRICEAYQALERVAAVEKILRRSRGRDGYYVEFERHQDLVDSLGLPASAVCGAFDYIRDGEIPEGLDPASLIWVGGNTTTFRSK